MDLFPGSTRRGNRVQRILPEHGVGGDSVVPPTAAGGGGSSSSLLKNKGAYNENNSVAQPVIELTLQSRVLDLEEQLLDLQGYLEKRFSSVEEEVLKRIAQKWEQHEIWDRRFKEHIRSEQEVNQSQMLNLKSSGLEYILQKGESEKKLVNEMGMKVSAMDAQLGQVQVMLEKVLAGDFAKGSHLLAGNQNLLDHAGNHMAADLLPGGVVHDEVLRAEGGVLVGTGPSSPSRVFPPGSFLSPGKSGNQSVPLSARSGGGGRENLRRNNHSVISSRLVRAASAGGMQSYNVALEHLKKQVELEQEARQLLQEEVTSNVKSLHAELQDWMQKQESGFLRDKKAELQQQHDERILKLSEGSVNSAFAQLKLELDVFQSVTKTKEGEQTFWRGEMEEKMLQNLSLATEGMTKNSKDLWAAYIELGREWKEAVASLQQIIEHKSGILLEQIDRKLGNQSEVADGHFIDQKKVNEAFDNRLAKAEMCVLQQEQKIETKFLKSDEEEKRWTREFSGLATVVGHVKTKIAALGKTQEGLEGFCVGKIKDEVTRAAEQIRGLAQEHFERFEALVEKTRIHADSVDKLNRENRRACASEVQNTEAKMQGSMQELTNSVTRLLQQAEFAQKALLSQKLEEEKEYVVGEIKAMENNNIEFRMQTMGKLDSVESGLIDRILGVDRKCYDAVEGQKKYLLKFEKQTQETQQKTRSDLDNQQKKFEIRTENRLNDQAVQVARDISDVWKKLDNEVKYLEKLTDEMSLKIKDHEISVQAELTNARGYWEEKFQRELRTLTEVLQQKLQTAIENERADRIRMEAERVQAMQKRLEAHESLNQRRHEELNQRRFEVFIKENEQLLTKKCDYLQDQLRDLSWSCDQEKIRQEEIRQQDLRVVQQWKKEAEAKQFATKHVYERTMTQFLNMHFAEQVRDFENMRRDNRVTAEKMQRALDQEKMERIKMVGETRAVLEESDAREHGNTRRTMEDNRRSLTRELDDFRENQDIENQKLQTETSRMNEQLSRKLKTTEDKLAQTFDEKLVAEQLERSASLEAAINSLADVYHEQAAFRDWMAEFDGIKGKFDEDIGALEQELDKAAELANSRHAETNGRLLQVRDNLARELNQIAADVLPADTAKAMVAKLNAIPMNVGDLLKEVKTELVEKGLFSVVAASEAKSFLKKEQDLLADGMTNKFLQGVLADTAALRQRIAVLESVGLGLEGAEAVEEAAAGGGEGEEAAAGEEEDKAGAAGSEEAAAGGEDGEEAAAEDAAGGEEAEEQPPDENPGEGGGGAVADAEKED
eukprot:g6714.t1